MKYGFLDETGDVSPFKGSRFLIVAILITDSPRSVERHVKRVRQKLRRKPKSGEMKASHSSEQVVKQLLYRLAKEDITIVSVVVDKQNFVKPLADNEKLYRWAVGQAICHCVRRWPKLTLYLDKRYTTKSLRDRLEVEIRSMLREHYQEAVLIRQEDSQNQKGIQAVDFIAWAVGQKYERNDERFYQIILNKIREEDVIDVARLF